MLVLFGLGLGLANPNPNPGPNPNQVLVLRLDLVPLEPLQLGAPYAFYNRSLTQTKISFAPLAPTLHIPDLK